MVAICAFRHAPSALRGVDAVYFAFGTIVELAVPLQGTTHEASMADLGVHQIVAGTLRVPFVCSGMRSVTQST